ncbi:MAG: hypothetical protein H7Z43_14345 [Clostridia bacterium]|nr:hypothetical protein [Deltaproteobacteria bacterium]
MLAWVRRVAESVTGKELCVSLDRIHELCEKAGPDFVVPFMAEVRLIVGCSDWKPERDRAADRDAIARDVAERTAIAKTRAARACLAAKQAQLIDADPHELGLQVVLSLRGIAKDDVEAVRHHLMRLVPILRQMRCGQWQRPEDNYTLDFQLDAYVLAYYVAGAFQFQCLAKASAQLIPAVDPLEVVLLGGGPGPELYGLLSAPVATQLEGRTVNALILDKRAEGWRPYCRLLEKYFNDVRRTNVSIQIADFDFSAGRPLPEGLPAPHLIVAQNTLNEVGDPESRRLAAGTIKLLASHAAPSALLYLSEVKKTNCDAAQLVRYFGESLAPVDRTIVNSETVYLPAVRSDILKQSLFGADQFPRGKVVHHSHVLRL